MKKLVNFIVLTLLTISIYADEINILKSIKQGVLYEKKFQKFVYANDHNKTKYKDVNGNTFSSDSEIIIQLKKNVDIRQFELRYGLSFKRKMLTGDYIFINEGSKDSLHIINQILTDDIIHIERIMPNMILNMQLM
jgi:hypothetical protein